MMFFVSRRSDVSFAIHLFYEKAYLEKFDCFSGSLKKIAQN